jgi:hypothetical protein
VPTSFLALFDREQARDFVEAAALVERLGLEGLCDLPLEKGPRVPRSVLANMLQSFGRFSSCEFEFPLSD